MQIESYPLLKEDIQRMLDITYELEGLLHLWVNREEDAPMRLMPLIKSKIATLSTLIENPGIPDPADYMSLMGMDSDDCSYAIPDEEEYDETPVLQTGINPESGLPDANDMPENAAESEPGICAECSVIAESPASGDVPDGIGPEDCTAVAGEISAASDVPDETDDEPAAATNDAISPESDEIAVTETVEESGVKSDDMAGEEAENKESQAAAVRQRQKVPVFSINDRFLYSRELFGGRVADFESALKDVAGMESYEEAEEYFYTEWNLDPESPVVKGFLDVISKCSNLN